MIELKDEKYVKMKNEIEVLNKKYQNALSEIDKLARFLKIFGKNEIATVWSMLAIDIVFIFVTNIQITHQLDFRNSIWTR